MRQVALPGPGVPTSVIGYGCSSLMARTPRKESVELLERAFDAGITHFDVARLYGYGEAESALGAFLQARRDKVTVTTKLGLDPPRRSPGLDLAKAAARRVVAVAPGLRRLARAQAGRMVQGGRFGAEQARASLETSLRELRTDHVDLLLLHECGPDDLTEGLLDLLRAFVSEGLVGAYGIATTPRATREVLLTRPEAAPTVQVANSLTAPIATGVPDLVGRPLITHSALTGALDDVHRHVTRDPGRAAVWSAAVGADCSDRQVLGELLLAWAMADNPEGVVLFSSRDHRRIAANAAVGGDRPRREEAKALARLVHQEMADAVPAA